MRFNPDLTELIPAVQLDADFGGMHMYEFETESYWEQIISCVFSTLIKLREVIVVSRACGIAPDGTRVERPKIPNGTPEAISYSSQSSSTMCSESTTPDTSR